MNLSQGWCPNCGGRSGYHNWPCSGGNWQQPYGQPLANPKPLTADDVRRIVREEMEKWVEIEQGIRFAKPVQERMRDMIREEIDKARAEMGRKE